MQCDEVARILPGGGRHGAAVELSVQRHIETCLRCQAELARYRRMLRGLQLLRTRYLEPTPGLLAQTLAAHRGGGRAPGRPTRSSRAAASPTRVPSAVRRSPPPGPPPRRCSSPGARRRRIASRLILTVPHARTSVDPWRPRPDDVIGSVALRIPYGGAVLSVLREPPLFAWFVGLDRARRPVESRPPPPLGSPSPA